MEVDLEEVRKLTKILKEDPLFSGGTLSIYDATGTIVDFQNPVVPTEVVETEANVPTSAAGNSIDPDDEYLSQDNTLTIYTL